MKSRKQQEFLALYEPVHNRFERFCRARVYGQMDFQDLMNETLLVAFQKFHTLKKKEAFLSFLFGICVRILSNHNRKNKEVNLSEEQEAFNVISHQRTEEAAEVYMLHKALAQLPEAQRESLILFEITGFSIKEIAALHEVSESAVKQRLVRGRQQLTRILTLEPNHQTGKEISHE